MVATTSGGTELPPGRPPVHDRPFARRVVGVLSTTDHKVIGNLYFVTTMAWFVFGGLLALLIRAELFTPGMDVVQNPQQFNQLFTMHGTIMLLMFATPLFAGFANVLVPLQIGAPDVAFPRLHALAYWLYFFGSLIAVGGFLTRGGAAAFGWFAYQPLAGVAHTPGLGGDLWALGLVVSGFGFGTILGSVNIITTIVCMRAPGMTMFRMRFFTWNALATSLMVLMVFPVLAAALFGMVMDRVFGWHIYDPAHGGAMLWEHLFWFFGHPEVYIMALPFFGIVTEVIPVFSRKPLFGYKTLVVATFAIAALSMSVWAHHMYATGAVLLEFWWPKVTGHLLDEKLGKLHFLPEDGFTWMNQLSTASSFLLAASMLPFFYAVWKSFQTPRVTVDDPWEYGGSLEWATSCPPPRHNFTTLPRIRSERPAFDLHHPVAETLESPEPDQSVAEKLLGGPDTDPRGENLSP